MALPTNNPLSKHSQIFLLTAVGLITLPHVLHIPASLFAFFTFTLLWRFTGIWRRDWLPGRPALFLLTLFGIALLYSRHQGLLGRDAGAALFVVALGMKLLEIHGKREVYLVVLLAFIVAASQFLYEQSILMAGYTLLVCAVLLATLIVQNSLRAHTWSALKTAAGIIAQALPIALVAFVFFPRLEAPHWLWLADPNRAKSGLSNTLEPGSISDLSLSDELVFRVGFAGEPPPPRLRYWRGPVYAFTDGVRWTAPANALFKTEQETPEFSGQAYSYTLLMEPQKETWVFALDMAAQFDSALHRNSLYQLISDKKPGDRAEYRITSYPGYNTGKLSQHELKDNLQLPKPPAEKITALVKQLHGFDASPEIFIRNILNYFHQENFHYTLTPPLMLQQPIEEFLFEKRSGFCSHYATAFVYLLRTAHIPARVVGGYQGGEFNKLGGFLEVRQADAHAWAEAWLDGAGWVRFDPTAAIAPERIERGVNIDLQIASGEVNFSPVALDAQALSWLKRGRQLWQSVDYNWQRWVINYDTASQSQFLHGMGIIDWAGMARWLIGSITAITLLLSWRLLKTGKKADQALLYYRRFCRKMAKTGIEIRLGEGARDFAERAKKQRPDLTAQIERITALFIRLRYQTNAQAEDLQVLKKLTGGLRV